MPVQLAMALSGIERDQWGDFTDLYDFGRKVMNQELPRRTRSRATNSTSSSRSTSPCSKESGIGSMTANSPIPLTLRDYCLFKLEAMQYSDRNALDVIQMFDTAGKDPVHAAGKDQVDTAGKEPADTTEKEQVDAAEEDPVATESVEAENQAYPVYTSELKWTGRNLLDLDANLTGNATMYRSARLPRGVKSYFENRSQISRVSGASSPPHTTDKCRFFDCNFESRRYYE